MRSKPLRPGARNSAALDFFRCEEPQDFAPRPIENAGDRREFRVARAARGGKGRREPNCGDFQVRPSARFVFVVVNLYGTFGMQRPARFRERVDAFSVALRTGDIATLFEHLQNRIDRTGTRAKAAAPFEFFHNVVTVAGLLEQRFQHEIFDAAAPHPAAVTFERAATAAKEVLPEMREMSLGVAPAERSAGKLAEGIGFKIHDQILRDISLSVKRISAARGKASCRSLSTGLVKMRSQYLLTLACAIVEFAGCAPHAAEQAPPGSPSAKIRIVAIERVYGDLARQLGGANVAVTTILNSPSADPHAYEATPRDADAISTADIVIENGLGYDAFAAKLAAASPLAGRAIVTVGALAGHKTGDNPHVWYEVETLRRFTDVLTVELARRKPAERPALEQARARLRAWLDRFSTHLRALAKRHTRERVAITEPVFDYVLYAAGLQIATPESFSHAIEEGNDPAPQDVDAMHALLANRSVAAFVYNRQTVEPSTTRLLAIANGARVPVVPVTETLPANESTQMWIDGEVAALERAL